MEQILGMFARQYYTVVKTAVDWQIRLPGTGPSFAFFFFFPFFWLYPQAFLFNLSEPQCSCLYVENSTSREEEMGAAQNV